MTPPINYDTPRVRIEHEWPKCPHSVGIILTLYKHGSKFYYADRAFKIGSIEKSIVERTINSGSNCLKQLAWWEERKLSDLPKYVKLTNPLASWGLPDGCIKEVTEWLFDELGFLHLDIFPNMIEMSVPRKSSCKIEPSTKEQYQTYIQSLNQPAQNG